MKKNSYKTKVKYLSILSTLTVLGLLSTSSFNYYEKVNSSSINKQIPQAKVGEVDADDFVRDLKNLNSGDTYYLQGDVDFNTLDDQTLVTSGISLDNVIIQGNGYTLSNWELSNKTLSNVTTNKYTFIDSISNSEVDNLNFVNFQFPFGTVISTSFNNINFRDTDYSEFIFQLEVPDYDTKNDIVNEEISLKYSSIGLFVSYSQNSNFNYVSIEGITFSNNIIEGSSIPTSSIVVSIFGIVKTLSASPISNFSNIYINDVEFSNNLTRASSKNNFEPKYWQEDKIQSIFYNPFIGASITLKKQGVTGIVNINNVIFNDIRAYGNTNTGSKFGTFYNLIPAETLNSQILGENIYAFNLSLDLSSATLEKISTGQLYLMGNYGGISNGFTVISKSGYYNKEDWTNLSNSNYGALSESTYESVFNATISSIYDSENGISQTSNTNWDGKYWAPIHYKNQDESLRLITKPSVTNFKINQYTQDSNKLNYSFNFRQGTYLYNGSWKINIKDLNIGKTISDFNVKSGETTSGKIKASDLFNPSIDLGYEITNSAGYSYFEDIVTEIVLPRISLLRNEIIDGKLHVYIEYYDPYSLINSIKFSLYFNNKFLSTQLYTTQEKTSQFEKKTLELIFNDDVNNYKTKKLYIDTKIDTNIGSFDLNYINSDEIQLSDDFINYASNNSVAFKHYKWRLPVWAIILLILLFLIIISIIVYLYIIYKRRKNEKNIALAIYEEKLEEYGIAIHDEKEF